MVQGCVQLLANSVIIVKGRITLQIVAERSYGTVLVVIKEEKKLRNRSLLTEQATVRDTEQEKCTIQVLKQTLKVVTVTLLKTVI